MKTPRLLAVILLMLIALAWQGLAGDGKKIGGGKIAGHDGLIAR